MLNDEELLRYSRHILLSEWDLEGQEKIGKAHFVIVGCGGLGNHVLPILAAAGVGKLTIIDFDKVELSNLQRQTAFTTNDIGKSKADTLKDRLLMINPNIWIDALHLKADFKLLSQICNDAVTAIIDCTDHFEIRYLINEIAVANRIPLISGSAIQFEGQFAVYDHRNKESPCYACLFDGEHHTDGNCATLGIFSPILGIIGALQAQEALKLALLLPLKTQCLQIYNALESEWIMLKFSKNPNCKICSRSR